VKKNGETPGTKKTGKNKQGQGKLGTGGRGKQSGLTGGGGNKWVQLKQRDRKKGKRVGEKR